MILAIDVGNTHTVFGAHDGNEWRGTWRLHTNSSRTEDEHGAVLRSFLERAGIENNIDRIVVASVVPALQETLERLASKWFHCDILFVTHEINLGLEVKYNPPSVVGADRLANSVAMIEHYGTPGIVLDFGTATTLDAISRDKEYLGGAIMPGVYVSMEGLFRYAAKIPKIALETPDNPIGRDTVNSLRSGIVLGYAGAIDTLVNLFKKELGEDTKIVATGGLAESVIKASSTVELSDPLLTLDGLKIISDRNP